MPRISRAAAGAAATRQSKMSKKIIPIDSSDRPGPSSKPALAKGKAWRRALDENQAVDSAKFGQGPMQDVHLEVRRNSFAVFGQGSGGGVRLSEYQATHERLIRQTKTVIMDTEFAAKCVRKRHNQKIFLFDLVLYLACMYVYFNVLISQFQIDSSFELERSMRDYMMQEELAEVKSLAGVFDYLETKLMPQLFPDDTWYNGDVYSSNEQGFILNYNKLVAGFSLIQQRVDTNKTCLSSSRFGEFLPDCWPAFSAESASSKVFGRLRNPTQYAPDKGTKKFSQVFPLDAELSQLMLMELKRNRWLDKQTRTVEAAFAIFNSAKQVRPFLASLAKSPILNRLLNHTYFRNAYFHTLFFADVLSSVSQVHAARDGQTRV
jgi:hypothetical protein